MNREIRAGLFDLNRETSEGGLFDLNREIRRGWGI